MEALAGRLDRLEASNRVWKRISFGLLGAMGILGIVGTNLIRAPRELAAERFVLKDDHGRPRAFLSLRSGVSPTLSLLDPNGKDQVLLRANPDGSSALEYFEDRSLRVTVASQAGVGSFLSLMNRGRRSRSDVYAWQDGRVGMEARRDLRGVSMQMGSDGNSRLGFTDKAGHERFGVGLLLDGTVNHHDESDNSAAGRLSISPRQNVDGPAPAPKAHAISTTVES